MADFASIVDVSGGGAGKQKRALLAHEPTCLSGVQYGTIRGLPMRTLSH